MPNRACEICEKLRFVKTADVKLLDKSGPFICSKECLGRQLAWIKVQPSTMKTYWAITVGAAWKVKDPPDHPNFKSDYERHFAEWMTAEGIEWRHERFYFELNGKTYTPDFWLPLHATFLETKGQWGPGQHKKIKLFREHFPWIRLWVVPWLLKDDFYQERKMWLR